MGIRRYALLCPGCEAKILLRLGIGKDVEQPFYFVDVEGQRLLGKAWVVPGPGLDRHDWTLRVLEMLFDPLLVEFHYPEMIEAWHREWMKAGAASALIAFAQQEVDSGRVRAAQEDIVHCLDLFVKNRSGILPGLAAQMYREGWQRATQDLRLFRDDFPLLRDLYINTFEACHAVLRFVVGFVNLGRRTDANNFGQAEPRNLHQFSRHQFSRLPNARKASLLGEVPAWDKGWAAVLDRSLRNGIGHRLVRHDLSAGALVWRDGRSVPYLDFVLKSLRLVHALLAAANVLRTIRTVETLSRTPATGGP
jgi:hypothetical protein